MIRGALPTAADAVATLRRFGPINEAKTRQDGAVIVEARGDDEVFRSNGALPLHKDGLLTGFDVILVGIYCVHFQEVSGGRTYVSDANVALRELAPEDVETLRSNGLEVMAVDASGYYRREFEAVWHRFPRLQGSARPLTEAEHGTATRPPARRRAGACEWPTFPRRSPTASSPRCATPFSAVITSTTTTGGREICC